MKTIGVILAGGASSRMGRDKAMLSVDEQTMLTRTYETLSQTTVSKVVISRNDGEDCHIEDVYPNKGPLSGIHSAANRFPEYNLLIVPVDLPLMDVGTLQNLLSSGEECDTNTRYGKHSLPLYLRNNESTRQTLERTLLCTKSFSVDRFCAHFPLQEIALEQQSSLFNTNTPEQWRYAMEHFHISGCPRVLEVSYGTFY